MQWASDMQSGWLGDDAPKVLEAAWIAKMVDGWGGDTVRRFRLSTGDALWCRLTKSGDLASVIACPWGRPVDKDTMPLSELYLLNHPSWPEWCRTKQPHLRGSGQDTLEAARAAHDPYTLDGMCVGLHSDRKTVTMFAVGSLDGAALESVRVDYDDDASDVPVASLAHIVRWWPLDKKHETGAKILIARKSPYPCHNWRLLTMQCANAVSGPRKKRPEAPTTSEPAPKPAKPVKPVKPATVAPAPVEPPPLVSRTIDAPIPPKIRARVMALQPESGDAAEWAARVGASFGWRDVGAAETLIRRCLAM